MFGNTYPAGGRIYSGRTMPRAELTLTIPGGIWIGELSRDYPDATFRIVSALPDDDSGVGLAEVTATHLADLLGDIEVHETITSLDVLAHREDTALVQFETSEPLLLTPVQGSGVPLTLPFDITDGEATWEITAPRERLSELGRQLDEFGIPFQVERIQQHVESDQLLTENQREIVTEAVEAGYYDTPRDCSLTELADRLGIAKSTCSETLHRAEEQIIKQFLDSELDGGQGLM